MNSRPARSARPDGTCPLSKGWFNSRQHPTSLNEADVRQAEHCAMRVVPLVLALIASGCAMRPTVNLTIDGATPNAVQAWGYPANDGSAANARYNSMGIDLQAAPPFVVALPDGYKADSRRIDSSLLASHFAPITRNDMGSPVSGIHHSNKRERYWMIFSLNKDGMATHLSLYACGHTMPRLLASADGCHVFDFPIKERELVQLFNGPVRRGKDFAILGGDGD